ncbi:DNA-binding response regulator, NarL/FixJ family, contains REC and HTH domains [Pustulibacterium marinum]|uniref:DNA-binding response regulator, NarL/FixJ family, contains REC and HTH domains n=1 Tax=Pustulibacterium marinum TaxID=1224947 RepID=A0A1I7GYG6_9FLAO|nr:response regulator [Pustulibacterium marinum]SFU53477.1 DNA-binding response regulator, NarL/FixJ family, contains REC and HTH domains [Pustulibacterium marinum]
MFQKILIAEDLHSITEGVQYLLNTLGIPQIQHVQYCDDAMLRLKKAHMDAVPFEVLITDLSFKTDHRSQQLTDGEALIRAVKAAFPEVQIIAYSIEDRNQRVKRLVQEVGIQAYVCKGRHGIQELQTALESLWRGETYVSPQVAHALHPQNDLNIEDFDIALLAHLAQGLSQTEISREFKAKNIQPHSLSAIEKRINKLKIMLKSANAVQLIAVSKDLGLI